MSQNPNEKNDVLIIGAGIAGLLAAREAMQRGLCVQLIEKARGVGGRIATRRLEDAKERARSFDHGCASFAIRSPRLAGLWSLLQEEKVLEAAGPGRLKGHPTMTALPKRLGRDLPIVFKERVLRIHPSDEGWVVIAESGASFSAGQLVFACPIPQALSILDGSGITPPEPLNRQLRDVYYTADAALMAIARDDAPRSLKDLSGVTLLGPRGTAGLLDMIEESALDRALEQLSGLSPETAKKHLEQVRIHRWRYSQVSEPVALPFAEVAPGVLLCGDAFFGDSKPELEGVERAALSGLSAGGALKKPTPESIPEIHPAKPTDSSGAQGDPSS